MGTLHDEIKMQMEIHKVQRDLNDQKMYLQRADVKTDMEDINSDRWVKERAKVDKNFLRVSDHGATARRDFASVKILASSLTAQANKGLGNVSSLNPVEFYRKLRGEVTAGGAFDWNALASSVGIYCFGPPSAAFLRGALKPPPVKERKVREKKKRATLAHHKEERPDTESKDEGEIHETTHHTRSVEHVRQCVVYLQERAPPVKCMDGSTRKGVNMFMTLMDPTSFTKTVETIFYFSFVIRSGMGALFIGEDKQYYITCSSKYGEFEGDDGVEASMGGTSLIVSMDPTMFRQLLQIYDITEPAIPPLPPLPMDASPRAHKKKSSRRPAAHYSGTDSEDSDPAPAPAPAPRKRKSSQISARREDSDTDVDENLLKRMCS